MTFTEKIWFTSDTHFGHTNILEFSSRPFKTVDEMDAELITRWNAIVGKKDIIYHLGDFALCDVKRATNAMRRLNGRIRLVRGNHDQKIIKGELESMFEWVKDYFELTGPNKVKIVLSHYAFETWNKSHFGSWQLHGHSHGSLVFRDVKRLDVGVDTHDYRPYSIYEIEKIMETRNIIQSDSHKKRSRK